MYEIVGNVTAFLENLHIFQPRWSTASSSPFFFVACKNITGEILYFVGSWGEGGTFCIISVHLLAHILFFSTKVEIFIPIEAFRCIMLVWKIFLSDLFARNKSHLLLEKKWRDEDGDHRTHLYLYRFHITYTNFVFYRRHHCQTLSPEWTPARPG